MDRGVDLSRKLPPTISIGPCLSAATAMIDLTLLLSYL